MTTLRMEFHRKLEQVEAIVQYLQSGNKHYTINNNVPIASYLQKGLFENV